MVRVGSTVPRPESAAPKSATPIQEQAGAPTIVKKSTPMEVDQHRGTKREREEGQPVVNGPHVNGGAVPAVIANGYVNGVPNGLPNTNGLVQQKPSAIALNAKAGTGNVRPRPIKKQRVVSHCSLFFSRCIADASDYIQDMSGQARDVTAPVQQQPTPQGV